MDEYVLHVGNRHHRHGFKAFLTKRFKISRQGYVKFRKGASLTASTPLEVVPRIKLGVTLKWGSISSTTMHLWGLNSLRKDLGRELIHGEYNRTVISVVGMEGVGRTTLAKKVADEQIATGHFDCHAWITVSIIQGGGSTKDHDKAIL
ncbi:disease resistance protein RPM1 [Gossypium australe]|uniref:Disease resistance protein RPM1 n=1 Tax=Gossypium australe TaxID=47621 RepID=A0A5B6WE05_9ROSI|nr:disease resistance protein RPM1 [Gossypium australe]